MDISKIKIDNSVLDVKDTTARSTLQLLGTASVKDAPASGNASNSQVVLGNDTRLSDPRPASDVYEWAKASTKPTYTKSEVGLGNVTNDSQVKRSEMGVASGVATLDSTGKVPSTQLPSYVDDVIEGYMYNGKFYAESAHTTLITGESGKIYSDLSTNKIYRWGGSAFAVVSETLAVGTTLGTAFDGKSGYDHVNNTNNPHSVTKSQVGLGNVGNFKAVSTAASQGLDSTEQSNARANIGLGSLATKSSLAASDIPTITKSKISDFPSSMPASDVSAWAKASSKPSYSYSEISGTPSSLPASDVSSWAKAANKPSYNLDEISDGTNKKWSDKIGKTIEITWANLKSLRDNSQLVPGQFYRITDYTCTTAQENTQSAGHVFDVIVRADDVNVLNENAYAAKHAGDTYFANSKLEAWELKYSLDNDTDRFMWADDEDGKGVIYYMKDEFRNECPYDFKNIQFKRWLATTYKTSLSDLNGTYCLSRLYDGSDGFYEVFSIEDEDDFVWRYTFHCYLINEDEHVDATLVTNNDGDSICIGNVIKEAHGHYEFDYYYKKIYLNDIIFYNEYEGNGRNICIGNYIHHGCFNNTFLDSCQYNKLGGYCYFNIIGRFCCYNTFGNDCSNNSLGNNCSNNSFGNYCNENTLGNDCSNNFFGNNCYENTLGNNCSNNTLGDNCSITFSKDYSQYNIIENGNKSIALTSTQSTSSSNPLRNIKICQGVGTGAAKVISHNIVNDTFQTEYKSAGSQTQLPCNAVDLGLPSGTKWADCNVGAKNPEDPGLYFQWGDNEGCSKDSGKYCNGFLVEERNWTGDYSATHGCMLGDSQNIPVDPYFDAARKHMGAPWRMPTTQEIQELFNDYYTTHQWTTRNGMNGYLVTSKSNGNSIFLPAAGCFLGGFFGFGDNGVYWSSSFNDEENAYRLFFLSDGIYPDDGNYRYAGSSVRAVQD